MAEFTFTVSGLILFFVGTIGYILNGISFCYFATQDNFGIINHLLMLLMFSDFCLCFSVPFVFYTCEAASYSIEYYGVINFLVQVSAMVTTTVTIVRALWIKYPFLKVNNKIIWGVVISLASLSLASNVYIMFISYDRNFAFYCGITISVVCMLLVAISGIYSYVIIIHERQTLSDEAKMSIQSWRHYSSITILILVAVFAITNFIGFVIAPILYYVVYPKYKEKWFIEVVKYADYCPSVNSALNPFVYLFRKKKLREYVSTRVRDVSDKIRKLFH